MTILGIDPGFDRAGWGALVADRGRVGRVAYGCIQTSRRDTAAERLLALSRGLAKIIKDHKPDLFVVEKLFFQKNIKTAIGVAEARGVILLAASAAGLRIVECTPLQVKQAVTGYGRADKSQIQKMIKVLLRLKEIPKPDDAADALAIAYTGWVQAPRHL